MRINPNNAFLARRFFRFTTALAVISLSLGAARAQTDGIWTANNSGNWTDSSKWAEGAVAGGAGSTANFSTVDITADHVVTLDAPVTLGTLLLSDSGTLSNYWTFEGDGPLVFDNGEEPGVIHAYNRNHVFRVPLVAAAGLNKRGSGLIVLEGDNSGLSGALTLENVTGTNSAGLALAGDNPLGGITTIHIGGSGNSGQHLVLRGGITIGPDVTVNLNTPGGNSAPDGGIRTEGAGTVNTIAGPLNVTQTNSRIANTGALRLDLTGPITAGENNVIFRKCNNEGIRLTNTANNWTGTTTHSEGTLSYLPGCLPDASALIIGASGAGTVQTSGSFTRALGINPGQVRLGGSETTVKTRTLGLSAFGGDLEVDFGGAGATLLFNNFTTDASGTPGTINTDFLVLNGTHATHNITLRNGLNLNGADRSIQVTRQTAEITGEISGANSLFKRGAGVLVLSGANSWTGEFRMPAGNTEDFGITRVTHAQAFGPEDAVKNIALSGSNRTRTVIELAGGITVDANKTMRTTGKSFHDPGTSAVGDQVSLRNHSGNNTWAGSIIISGTGGGYGVESTAGGTLTLGAAPDTDKTIYNDAGNDNRAMAFFGGGDIVLNLKLATNPGNPSRRTTINKVGSGTLSVPRTDNDFSETPNLRAGTTEIVSLADAGTPSSLGTGPAINLGGVLRYIGAGDDSGRALGLLHSGGTLDSSGSGPLRLTAAGFSHQAGVANSPSSAFAEGATSFTVNEPAGIVPGQTVTGTGIAPGTTVAAVDVDSRTITIDQPTTVATNNGYTMTFGGQNNLDRTLTLTGSNTGDNLLAANLSNPSGTGKLAVAKTGPGTWEMSGMKSFTGGVEVAEGRLVASNSFPAIGGVSVAAGATLALDDVQLDVDPDNGLALEVDGTLEILGPVVVNLPQASPSPGTYPVIQAGAITGDPAQITGSYRGSTGSATASGASLTVGQAKNLVWTGDSPENPAVWDVITSANWRDASMNPEKFYYGDSILFDDTSNESIVSLDGILRPGAMTVNTDWGYTFWGSGQLTGPFTLVKKGEGTLDLGGEHSFSGGITIEAGVLRAGSNRALGADGQLITIHAGGTLDAGGHMNAHREYEALIAGDGADDSGAIINTGGEHLYGFRRISLAADASIGGYSRWDLRPAAGTGSFAAELDLAGHTLTKTGYNNIALVDGVVSSDGNIIVEEGMLSVTRMDVSGAGTVTVNPFGVLRLENYTVGSFDKEISLPGGTLRLVGSNLTLAQPITLPGEDGAPEASGYFDIENGRTLTVTGVIGGTGGLAKTSSTGHLTLAAENTYTGPTEIQGSTLIVGTQELPGTLGAGEVANDGLLVINRGDTEYEVANTISGTGGVNIGQNSDGSFDSLVTLTGANTFTGNVSVNSGGLLIRNAGALGEGAKNITVNNGTAGRPQLYLDGTANDVTLPADFTIVASSTNQSHPAIGSLAGDNVIEGNILITTGGGNAAVAVLGGSLTLNGGVSANNSGRNLDLGGEKGADGIVNGVVSNGSGGMGIQKFGANTWTLTGANNYTGATNVHEGTLLINGNQAAASGNVVVNSGAVLGGTGSIGGTVVSNEGGVVAPGVEIGTLTATGGLLRGTLEIEVDGADADFLAVTGSLSLSGATLAIRETGAGLTEPVYVIASYAILNGEFAALSGVPAGYGVDYNYQGANQIALVEGMATPFQNWIEGFAEITNPADKLPGADPDGDGHSNLLEFALNGNPADPAANGYLHGATAAVPGVGQALIVTFATRAGADFKTGASASADGVTYTVRGSLDLASFPESIGVSEVKPAIVPASWPAAGGGYEYHTFRLDASTGLPDRGFLRLEISE